VPGIVGLAAGAAVLCGTADPEAKPRPEDPFSLWSLLVLTGRLFVFTAGLVLLGDALTPLMERAFLGLHPALLYWANAFAAVTDNAALVAVQVSPTMSQDQLRHAFLGVLTSGSAFLSGDPPNLVAAHRLGISARSWALVGVPASLALMAFCFLSLAGL
jgi:predicted cation transporter